MAQKVTVMVLKVDLQCPCCYKKVKKILCKFPQIKDQVYDEKANTVRITVVCCNPEKIRDKLCCKGSKVIKSIEIKEPSKPKQPENPKEPEKPKQPEKPKEPEKSKVVVIEKPKEPEKPKVIFIEKPKEPEKPKETPKPDPPKNPAPAPAPNPPPPQPVMGPGPVQVDGFPPHYPVRTCCGQCYEGYGGGPCYQGYGTPPPPQPCYDGYYGNGYGYGYGYGYGRGCRVSRCDSYFSEENPQSCSIM